MKITDKTTGKTDSVTFKQGDVVKATYKNDGDESIYLVCATPQNKTTMVNLLGESYLGDSQDGERYNVSEYTKQGWTFEKVTAEVVITN